MLQNRPWLYTLLMGTDNEKELCEDIQLLVSDTLPLDQLDGKIVSLSIFSAENCHFSKDFLFLFSIQNISSEKFEF